VIYIFKFINIKKFRLHNAKEVLDYRVIVTIAVTHFSFGGENYFGSNEMNPVIGLDVSKGESHAQAFADRGTPYGKTFRFKHDFEGLLCRV